MLSSRTDWELLAEKNRAEDAFHVLFERNRDYVYRLAYGLTSDSALAEDATQEVFLRLYRDRRRWQPKAAFRTLLYRITVNTPRELRRKCGTVLEAKIDETAEEHQLAASCMRESEHQSELLQLLSSLPDRQREVVLLRFFEDLSLEETAAVMGCRIGTVKAHLNRAMRALRQKTRYEND